MRQHHLGVALAAVLAVSPALTVDAFADQSVQLGPRPFYLVDEMSHGPAQERSCSNARRRHVQAARCSRSATAAAAAAVPRAHQGEPRSGRAHGRGHPRVRRDLHEGQATRLPPRPVRPAHDDQHPRHARWPPSAPVPFSPGAFDPPPAPLTDRRRPCAARATSRSPSSRPCGQDGRLESRTPRRRQEFLGGTAELAHRPVLDGRDAADAQGEHRAHQVARREVHARAQGGQPQRQAARSRRSSAARRPMRRR